MTTLSDVIGISRRYTRSVSLERDLAVADAFDGYVLTPKGGEALRQMAEAARTPRSVRTWTISGPYGTGKSAFALFMARALAAPRGGDALTLIDAAGEAFAPTRRALHALRQGLLPAVAVAAREPLAHVVVRALASAVATRWPVQAPAAASRVRAAAEALASGGSVTAADALAALQALLPATPGLVLVLDELGKVLEYASIHPGREDLYLLQQLAELPAEPDDPPVLVVAVLHRSFADYTLPMHAGERAEWAKVQGRYEDIAFGEGPAHMVRLVGQAIDRRGFGGAEKGLDQWASSWSTALNKTHGTTLDLDAATIRRVFPLHPLAAVALPILCAKYAQNDRSMFSFLTSHEAHGFQAFLAETPWSGAPFTTLRPHHLYDYFVETARMNAVSRPEFQRWSEISARVEEASRLPDALVAVVKTVGLFNLIAMSGPLRASRLTVAQALSDGAAEMNYVASLAAVDEAISRKLITWRKQADELRIWDGSDFDVEAALETMRASVTEPLPTLLEALAPLPPLIARRHSYESGTLRYFERRYLDDPTQLEGLAAQDPTADGILVHWLGAPDALDAAPKFDAAGGPVLYAGFEGAERVRRAALEVVALDRLEAAATQLHADGIARREVRQRQAIARATLDQEVARACGLANGGTPHAGRELNGRLSKLCDEAYGLGPRLWTELLNRRELTSQGAKARRELIAAMLERAGEQAFGFTGYGPEVSMARSALEATGLYRPDAEGRWHFGAPKGSMAPTYLAIDNFVAETADGPRSVDLLFAILRRPPYGLKAGPLPVLLAAYMAANASTVGFYQDGSFVPSLGAEHFELLMKHPQRFALKTFRLVGARAAFRDALAANLASGAEVAGATSLVQIVKQLLIRSRRWSEYTRRTTAQLGAEAIAVRNALLNAREPDLLIFEDLPAAVGAAPLTPETPGSASEMAGLASRVMAAFAAVDAAQGELLARAADALSDAFGLPRGLPALRQALAAQGVGARATLERTATDPLHPDAGLRRFLIAASDPLGEDRPWLEALLMIAVDRPVDTWRDADEQGLTYRLAALARRYRSLAAFSDAQPPAEGRVARRLAFSAPDGEEFATMVWIDETRREAIDALVRETLATGSLAGNQELQEAFVATLIERVFQLEPAPQE